MLRTNSVKTSILAKVKPLLATLGSKLALSVTKSTTVSVAKSKNPVNPLPIAFMIASAKCPKTSKKMKSSKPMNFARKKPQKPRFLVAVTAITLAKTVFSSLIKTVTWLQNAQSIGLFTHTHQNLPKPQPVKPMIAKMAKVVKAKKAVTMAKMVVTTAKAARAKKAQAKKVLKIS